MAGMELLLCPQGEEKTVKDDSYQEFPAITVGGPTGDYIAKCPVTSCEWAEYAIDSIVNGDGGTGSIVVSSIATPKAVDYAGVNVLSDTTVLRGIPFRLLATSSLPVNGSFERIVNDQKWVFVRIDAAASTSMYVTIRFKVKILAKIPAPFVTVRPEDEQLVHAERERRIQAAVLGQGEEYAYASRPVEKEQIVEPNTGQQPVTKLGYCGKIRR